MVINCTNQLASTTYSNDMRINQKVLEEIFWDSLVFKQTVVTKNDESMGLLQTIEKKICQIADVIVLEEHKGMTNRKKKKLVNARGSPENLGKCGT